MPAAVVTAEGAAGVNLCLIGRTNVAQCQGQLTSVHEQIVETPRRIRAALLAITRIQSGPLMAPASVLEYQATGLRRRERMKPE
jgi:hypothetical protein